VGRGGELTDVMGASLLWNGDGRARAWPAFSPSLGDIADWLCRKIVESTHCRLGKEKRSWQVVENELEPKSSGER
jgi:hypothetical protein